jgi:hypothetical protein
MPDGKVVALPDSWWNHGLDGARAREGIRRDAGGPVIFAPRAVAAVASLPAGARQLVLTCDVTADGVTVALSEVDDGVVTPLQAATGGLEHVVAPELVPALRADVAGQRRRATLVLDRAATLERWWHTPVFDGLPLTAAELTTSFAPMAQAIRTCASAVTARGGFDAVYVLGELAALPTVSTVLAETVGEHPELLEPTAVELGALRIAQGQRTVAEDPVVTFPAHRVLDGRLVTDTVPVGEQVTVTATSSRWLAVELDGRRRAHVRLPTVQPGSYECGWWPTRDGNGVVVLRPAGDGEPVFALVGDSEPIDERDS